MLNLQQDNETSTEKSAMKKGLGEKYFLPRSPFQRTLNFPFKSQPGPTHMLPEVMLRREFKIAGQIGESGQKEKLSYLSLARQIEVGIEKGHTDT